MCRKNVNVEETEGNGGKEGAEMKNRYFPLLPGLIGFFFFFFL